MRAPYHCFIIAMIVYTPRMGDLIVEPRAQINRFSVEGGVKEL